MMNPLKQMLLSICVGFPMPIGMVGYAQEYDLAEIRKNVATAEKPFHAMKSVYRLSREVAPKVIASSKNKATILADKVETIDGVWHGKKFAFHYSVERTMGDGSTSSEVQIHAYDGRKGLQNINNEFGSVLIGETIHAFINPRLIAAPTPIGRLGSLNAGLNIDLDKLPYFSGLNYSRKIQYKHQGTKRIKGIDCQVVSITRSNATKPLAKYVLYICPSKSWQVLRSEEYRFDQSVSEPVFESAVTKWKKIENKHWIPSVTLSKYYRIDHEDGRELTGTEQFFLESVSLKCASDNPRFSNGKFIPSMEIHTADLTKSKKQGR